MNTPDIVFVQSLGVEASIGVYDWEKQIKQKLLFDLELSCNLIEAGISDNVDDTVCYATVCESITKLTQSQHFELLEALAEQICSTLLTQFPIDAITLRIHKPGAVPEAQSVGIQISRHRLQDASI